MLVVRDIFQLEFGKAQQAIKLLKRGSDMLSDAGYPVARIMTDVTGEYYTIVMESEVESLSAFEKGMEDATGLEEWGKLYHEQFVPLVRRGRREIFRIVE